MEATKIKYKYVNAAFTFTCRYEKIIVYKGDACVCDLNTGKLLSINALNKIENEQRN